MAIVMRRGNPEDFDPTKMLPGEFAVTLGTGRKSRKLYICFAPGEVKQLGTYEDFEDMISDATVEVKEQYITAFNDILQQIRTDREQVSEEYEYVSSFKTLLEGTYKAEIEQSVQNASDSAEKAAAYNASSEVYKNDAKTYMDNAKLYAEQAKEVSEGLKGALQPHGTLAFKALPPLDDVEEGWMYNISDEFTTTDDFKEGSGKTIPLGANIYKTTDGKWDVLAGTPVTGIKGENEDKYRQGNVNITKSNMGLSKVDNTADIEKVVNDIDMAAGTSIVNDITALENGMLDLTTRTVTANIGDTNNRPNGGSVKGYVSKFAEWIKTAIGAVNNLVVRMGSKDISKIGDGTVTGAVSTLNSSLATYNPDDITRIALLTDKSKLGERLQLSESMWHFKYISFKINQGYTRAIIIPSSWLKYYMAHSWWMPIEWRFRESYLMCINIISSTTDGTTIDFLENQVEVLGWSFTNMEIFGINKLL